MEERGKGPTAQHDQASDFSDNLSPFRSAMYVNMVQKGLQCVYKHWDIWTRSSGWPGRGLTKEAVKVRMVLMGNMEGEFYRGLLVHGSAAGRDGQWEWFL